MDTVLNIVSGINNVAGILQLWPELEENELFLRTKIGLLEDKKVDIHVRLQNEARCPGKKRRREVGGWRNNVETIKNEFGNWVRVQQSTGFYNVFKRQKLAQQLERMTKVVTDLVSQSDFPNGLFIEVDESISPPSLNPQPNNQAFKEKVSEIRKSLMRSLMGRNVVSIGIYGMRGVGKTTLARHVYEKLQEESIRIYWVTVSQEFRIHKLQSDIAEVLKIDITHENDERRRADKLLQEFRERERSVLILDNVWEKIDAEKIGIPYKSDGCSLVITSRLEAVCLSMECNEIIKVNTLSEEEAPYPFFKTLGLGRDELCEEVKVICDEMVNRCSGLPLALITLAASMIRTLAVSLICEFDVCEWRDALEGLESCLTLANGENEVLLILFHSYRQLRDTKLQRCFLHCSSYSEDTRISRTELIGKFISENLMEPRQSPEAASNQGLAILKQLENACLLKIDSDGYLKMHNLIREMANRIRRDSTLSFNIQ